MQHPDRQKIPVTLQIKKSDQAVRHQVNKLDAYHKGLSETMAQWAKVQWTDRRHAYTNPPIILEALSGWSTYAIELDRAKGIFESSHPLLLLGSIGLSALADQHMAVNPFSQKVNGISLGDITNMSLPLSTVDIRKIDLASRPTKKLSGPGTFVRDVIGLAATQAELYPSRDLSDPTKQLVQRIKNYWEYYTVWALSSKQSANFLGRLMADNNLLQGLLAFIPARLHISPSSTYRLFDAHIENTNPVNRHILHHFSYPRFLNEVASFLKGIPNPKGLPEVLTNYQYTDAQAESELVKQLNRSYQKKAINHKSESELHDETRTLAQKLLSQYYKDTRQTIRASREGFIRFSPGPDSFFEEVLVGLLYGKTFSITGLLKDGESSLTVDLIKQGRLFGIPPEITIRNPLLGRLLMLDLMAPLLPEAETKTKKTSNEAKFYPEPTPAPALPESGSSEEAIKTPKRRTLETMQFITNSTKIPELSTASLPQKEEENNNYALVYRDQTITDCDVVSLATLIAKDLLPKDQRLQSDIQIILESLIEDPYGPGTYKITHAFTTIKGRKVPLRSFRGDTRKLPFKNKNYSDRLRSVYYIDPKTRSITLEEIMTHDRFDSLFTDSKH